MKAIILTSITLLTAVISYSQNVGINSTGAAPAASAMLDIDVTNKGLLIPRVALTATNAAGPIAAPATSLLVYNTATAGVAPNNVTPGYYYWSGTAWLRLMNSGSAWELLGNAGTTSGTNFVGTIDGQALDFRTNNTLRFRVANANQVHAMANGTAALPFYSWSNDANTGMSSIAADQLNWSTGGAERLRLTNTQLATTFLGTAAAPAYSFTGDPNTGIFSPGADVVAMSVNSAERLRSTNTEVVVNENANAVNFRVEGASNANLFVTNSANTAVGFQRVPPAQSIGGALVVNDMYYPFEIGNDGGGSLQAAIGWYNASDVIMVPETDWYGFVGNATRAWYRMYSYGFINVSSKEKKRDVTPIVGNKPVENFVMNSIDNMQTYFYKYNNEEESLNESNYTKYRPMFHLGTILEESPDFLKDASFGGIDIYAVSSLALSGVKINHNEIKELKGENKSITDFGSVNATSSLINVAFDSEFAQKLGNQIPVITLSTNHSEVPISIISKSGTGFTVKINGAVPNDLYFDWIAMAKKQNTNENTTPELDPKIKNQLEVPAHIKEQMIELYKQTPTVSPTGK